MTEAAERDAAGEERACVAFATMLNTVDADAFVSLLAPDAVWESQQVLTPLEGKKNVERHVRGKMAAMLAGPPRTCAELGRCGKQSGNVQVWSAREGRPCVLVYQGDGFRSRTPGGLVLFETSGELVTRVDLCTVAPSPLSADRSGTYPGLKRSCWPGEPPLAATNVEPFNFKADLAVEEFLAPENVLVDVPAASADEVHWQISRALARSQPVEWFHIYEALSVRHRLLPLGFEGGWGMPHEEVKGVTGIIGCLTRTKVPVHFGASDGPTRLFFAVTSANGGRLMRATTVVMRLMKDAQVREALLQARSADEMYEVVTSTGRKYVSLRACLGRPAK